MARRVSGRRLRSCCRACGKAALIWALGTLLSARAQSEATGPGLRWTVSAEIDCPSTAEVDAALRARFGVLYAVERGEPRAGDRALYLGRGPKGLLYLWLWEEPSDVFTERELPRGEASCKDLADAVALLADTWLQKLPLRKTEDRPPTPPPTPLPARRPPVVVGSLSPLAPASGPSPWTLGFEARLGVLGSAGLDASEGRLGGALAAELRLTRWLGVGVQLELWPDQVDGDPDFSGGQLVVHRQAAVGYARLRLFPNVLPGLSILAGVRVQHVGVETQGYPASVQQDLFPVSPWVGTLYELLLSGWLRLFAQLAADDSFAQQGFYVSDPGVPHEQLYLLPAATLSGAVGLSIALE